MVDVLREAFSSRTTQLVIDGIEAMGFVADGGDRQLLEQTVKTYFAKVVEARGPDACKR